MSFAPVTIASLGQSAYEIGEHDGALIPWPAGATNIVARGLLNNTDLANANLHCGIGFVESFDGGLTTSRGPTGNWDGNTINPHDQSLTPPEISTGYGSNPPTHIGVIITLPQALSIGAVIDFS
jgi:hypothetical protein